jgi:DNA polymerase-1
VRIINTADVLPEDIPSQTERDWVYNGKDCCVTSEVYDVLTQQLDNHTTATYNFEKDLQGPILEMRIRGVLIDHARRDEVIDEYFEKLDILEENLNKIVGDGLDLWEFKWSSPKDLQLVFYDILGIPTIRRGGRPTVDRPALEKLYNYYPARPILAHMLAMRDLQKKIQMLRTSIDRDGRIRTSYNIAGTTTGRLSSSFSEFGTGTNLQNIEEILRSVFIADPGMKMAYIDAQQGESRVVGAIEWNLFRDPAYLDACESGDLHTTVAKLVWPSDVPWTGNLIEDRKLAERPYYRHYDRRFMCKKIGHGTNYGGEPETLAAQAKVDKEIIKAFQPVYFKAFPAHHRWHEWTQEQIRRYGNLVSLTNRKRYFFGRRNDPKVLREAIAYQGQALGDILNKGMLSVWKANDCQVLMQIHDAILIQYPEGKEDEIIPKVMEQILQPIQLEHGRVLTIPYDCAVGFNWGKFSESNPDGLKSWKGNDKRKRTPQTPILDRQLRGVQRKVPRNLGGL